MTGARKSRVGSTAAHGTVRMTGGGRHGVAEPTEECTARTEAAAGDARREREERTAAHGAQLRTLRGVHKTKEVFYILLIIFIVIRPYNFSFKLNSLCKCCSNLISISIVIFVLKFFPKICISCSIFSKKNRSLFSVFIIVTANHAIRP